jgi:hypothetical protein
MSRAGLTLLVGALFALSATAQTQTGAHAGAQANAQTSVQAGRQGAQASANGGAATNASANAPAGRAALASGMAINAELNSSLDSKKAKEGEAVTARTTEAVNENGKTVLPRGTKLVGHVTRSSARAKGDGESALAIQFDHAMLKHGREIPLDVTIQALASVQSAANLAGDDMDMMGSGGTYAGGSAAPAARGGLGGVTSAAGGAVGAVANTAANAGNMAGGAVDAAARTGVGVVGASQGAVGGLNAAGQFTSNSRGVFGLRGLNLNAGAANSTQGSLITSTGKSVHLDSGTRMLLVSHAWTSSGENRSTTKGEAPNSQNGRPPHKTGNEKD